MIAQSPIASTPIAMPFSGVDVVVIYNVTFTDNLSVYDNWSSQQIAAGSIKERSFSDNIFHYNIHDNWMSERIVIASRTAPILLKLKSKNIKFELKG